MGGTLSPAIVLFLAQPFPSRRQVLDHLAMLGSGAGPVANTS